MEIKKASVKNYTIENLIDEILSKKIKKIVVITGAGRIIENI